MSRFEDLKLVLASDNTKELGKQFSAYAIKAISGDVESIIALTKIVFEGPAFYKNIVFLQKLKMFLNGVYLNEDDYKDLTETIANGNQEENAARILDCLDSLEASSKVRYLINATRSHIRFQRGFGGLNKSEYFRMLYVLKNILLEDIEFLKQKLKLTEVMGNESCMALNNLGLMYVSTIGEETKYAFTSLAYKFYGEVIVQDDETLPKISEPNVLPGEFQTETNIIEFGE